jgi:hypothetical protein
VLISGNVDTVDSFAGVLHPFPHETVLAPFPYTQSGAVVGHPQLYAETLSQTVFPMALEVAAVCLDVCTVAFSLLFVVVAEIDAGGVRTQAGEELVVATGTHDGAS